MQRWSIPAPSPRASVMPAAARSRNLAEVVTDVFVVTLIVGFPLAFAVQGLLGLGEGAITLLSRVVTMGLALATLLLRPTRISRGTGLYICAMICFTVLYGWTMVDRLFLEQQESLAPPSVMFGLFLGIGIVPSIVILLCGIRYDGSALRMRAFLRLLLLLNSLFLALALYNGRDLLGTEFGRFKVEGGINQIYLGHMGVLNLYLVFYLATLERASLSLFTKALMLGACALGFATIVLAGSRGPFIALYVVILIIFLSRIRRTSGLVLGVLGLTSIAAFLLFVDPYEFREMTGSNLLIRIFDNDDLREELRLVTYEMAWDIFLQHPLLGREFLVLTTYPHNFMLEILMATGAVGMAVFLVMYLPAWKECIAACFRGRLTLFHVFFVHMSVMFMFSGAVWGMHLLWTALAIVLVLKEPTPPAPPREASWGR